jgi:two-component system, OmpR family, sensor kinase
MTQRLTFRTRLMLASTAIVAVAVLLLGAVAFVTIRLAMSTALDTRLETTAQAIRSVVDIKHGALRALDHEDHAQFLAILGEGVNGAILRSDGSLLASNLAAPPRAILDVLARADASHGTVQLDRGAVVYSALPIDEDGVRYGTVAAWESRSVYDDAARLTLIALGIAGVIVVVAAAAVAGTLTRRMLRPVTDLSAMISDIEASDLTERLEWSGPDDELGTLCSTFDRLLDRLETAFERERRFIADASHELRTPLSVMRAEVELALMHERTPEAYRSALARLQRETQRLEALAQSLILTTRNGNAGLSTTPVRAGVIADRARARMQPLATSRGIALGSRVETDVAVMADADMLERAIVALIDNALRFARRSVDIRVTSEGSDACIAVSDDGAGFSDGALLDATSRFWRDDPARSGDGTGLGLAIARSIIERHGGTIALRNATDGSGAVVLLTVPAILAVPR